LLAALLQGLLAKGRWQLELKKREAAAKKVAEQELYRKTHCKRNRNPAPPKEPASAQVSEDNPATAATGDVVPNSPDIVSNSAGNKAADAPVAESKEQEPVVKEVCSVFETVHGQVTSCMSSPLLLIAALSLHIAPEGERPLHHLVLALRQSVAS
jgi:hypothetical protein